MQSSSSGQGRRARETGRPTTLLTHSKILRIAQECLGGSRACAHFHRLIDMTKTATKKTTTPKVTFAVDFLRRQKTWLEHIGYPDWRIPLVLKNWRRIIVLTIDLQKTCCTRLRADALLHVGFRKGLFAIRIAKVKRKTFASRKQAKTTKPTKATLKKVPLADCGRYDAFRRILIFVTSWSRKVSQKLENVWK